MDTHHTSSYANLMGRRLIERVLSKASETEYRRSLYAALEGAHSSHSQVNAQLSVLSETLSKEAKHTTKVRSDYVLLRLEQACARERELQGKVAAIYDGLDTHPDIQQQSEALQSLQTLVDDLEKHREWLQAKLKSLHLSAAKSRTALAACKEELRSIFRENVVLTTMLKSPSVVRDAPKAAGSGKSRHLRVMTETSAVATRRKLVLVRHRKQELVRVRSERLFQAREIEEFYHTCWQATLRHGIKQNAQTRKKTRSALIAHRPMASFAQETMAVLATPPLSPSLHRCHSLALPVSADRSQCSRLSTAGNSPFLTK